MLKNHFFTFTYVKNLIVKLNLTFNDSKKIEYDKSSQIYCFKILDRKIVLS